MGNDLVLGGWCVYVCVGLPAAHCSSHLPPPSELSPPHEHHTAEIPLGHSCEGGRVCARGKETYKFAGVQKLLPLHEIKSR